MTQQSPLYVHTIGLTTCLGKNLDDTWENLIKGQSFFSPFSFQDKTVTIGKSPINDKPGQDRTITLGCAAIQDALDHIPNRNNGEPRLLLGCTKGASALLHQQISNGSTQIPEIFDSSFVAREISKQLQLPYVPTPYGACASGAYILKQAQRILAQYPNDTLIVCMTESSLSEEVIAGFYQLGVLSKEKTPNPFCQERDGFCVAEGAACLIINSNKNGAICQISDVLLATDAGSFTGFPYSLQRLKDLLNTLSKDNLNTFVSLHGTGTIENDEMEIKLANYLNQKLNPHYYIATKQSTGHHLGASGFIETALCIKSLQTNTLPPLKLEKSPEQNIPKQLVINDPIKPEEAMEAFLNFNYGLGGTLSVIKGIKIND